MPDLIHYLLKINDLKVEKDVPLSQYTAWKVGGPVEFMAFARTHTAVAELLKVLSHEQTELFVLGNGSNILVSDRGISGVALKLAGDLAKVEINEGEVRAGGGVSLNAVVTEASRAALAGIEFAFGIPGTMGGAVMTNAGAFGSSLASVLERVEVISLTGENRDYTDFQDIYRAPLVPLEEVVTRAVLKLLKGSGEEISRRMDHVRAQRKATQPWGMSTAGSVFKNPVGDYAGRLIEACGLKSRVIGEARVSEIHSNFIINQGGARSADIKSLIDLMRTEVEARFGVKLELEVKMLGFEEE